VVYTRAVLGASCAIRLSATGAHESRRPAIPRTHGLDVVPDQVPGRELRAPVPNLHTRQGRHIALTVSQ